MRFMMLVTNLVVVNVLWLLCCIPVITAGASTVAMHTVLLRHITGKDDAVFKPFFRAFKENFLQATVLWIPTLLIGAVMAAEIVYLSVGSQTWLKVIFGILLFIYGAAISYLYPLVARYQNTSRAALFNSFALAIRHLFTSVCVVTLNALPVVLLVAFPDILWNTKLVWTLIGFSLTAYLILKILLPVLRQYEDPEEENCG